MFAKDGEIILTLNEISYDDGIAVLQDPKGKFYLLQNGGLFSGNSVTDFSKFIADGSFDDSETESKHARFCWYLYVYISPFLLYNITYLKGDSEEEVDTIIIPGNSLSYVFFSNLKVFWEFLYPLS